MPSSSKAHLRKYIRVQPRKDRPVVVDINGKNFLEVVHASDISESGIGFQVPGMFQGCRIDDEVSIVISLPHPVRRMLKITAVIRHVSDTKFGVHFLNLDRDRRKAIRHYVESLIAQESFRVRTAYRISRWKLALWSPMTAASGLLVLSLLVLYRIFSPSEVLVPVDLPLPEPPNEQAVFKREDPRRETRLPDQVREESKRLVVAEVVLKDRSGNDLSRLKGVVLKGGWVALPFRRTLGSREWVAGFAGGQRGKILEGIWAPHEMAGLWKIEGGHPEGEVAKGPALKPWDEHESLRWISAETGRTSVLEPVEEAEVSEHFRMARSGEAVRGTGVLFQGDRVVGWTFDAMPGDLFLWKGGSSSALVPDTGIDRFYRLTFEGGREEHLLHVMRTRKAPADRLKGLADGLKMDAVLREEDTPPGLRTAAVLTLMKKLVGELAGEENHRAIAGILEDPVTAEKMDADLILQLLESVEKAHGIDRAIRLSEQYHHKIDSRKQAVLGLYQRRIIGLIEQGDPEGAWDLYLTALKYFPLSPGLNLLATEIYLAEGDLQNAEMQLSSMEYPRELLPEREALSQKIAGLKNDQGKIVIRFEPGSRQIEAEVLISGFLSRTFLIDTGATMVSIPTSFAEELGLAPDEETPVKKVVTAGGEASGYEVTLPSLEIDGHTVSDVRAMVMDMPGVSTGLLGLNFIRRFHMELDDTNGKLYLTPQGGD